MPRTRLEGEGETRSRQIKARDSLWERVDAHLEREQPEGGLSGWVRRLIREELDRDSLRRENEKLRAENAELRAALGRKETE